VLVAHDALVSRGVIEPLAKGKGEAHDWLAWELASLIEGHFHRTMDARALSRSEWQEWERRVTGGIGLGDPRREQLRRVYWLLDQGGERAGTIALDTIRIGRPEIGISSLYLRPELRGSGIATRALDAVYDVAPIAGADGVRVDTNWSWQGAVRFYLKLGYWVRSWKHALVLARARRLRPYRIEMMDTRAVFSVLDADNWTPLIQAENRGAVLGWTELAACSMLDQTCRVLASGTLALHLAVRGWPLVRSTALWDNRYDWSDMGMPEGLACKIAIFESIDRQHGYEVRTPSIPGLDYTLAEDDG